MTPKKLDPLSLDAIIPRFWAADDLRRRGVEPTPENIDAYLEAMRKLSEEESKYCSECGREKEADLDD